MSKLKPITEYTATELLELIKTNPTDGVPITNYEHPTDVMEFIAIYRLTDGPNQILLPIIYELYKRWSKKPLHRNPFGKEMSKFFTSVKYGMGTTYRLNKSKDFFLERSLKKKQNKTKRKPWLKHFKLFMNHFNLKSGSFYVKDVVLYNLYDKWTYKNGNKNPLSFPQFLKFCRLFFSKPEIKTIRGTHWFAVDSNLKEKLTPDLINLMKQK